jgi:carbamoyltransferase
VQTVTKEQNARYHALISEFKAVTGVPVLLNTSFNNNAEPIVDSVDDAVVSFLTTNLHYLVVGDHLAKKRDASPEAYRKLVLDMPRHVELHAERRFDGARTVVEHFLSTNHDKEAHTAITAHMHAVLLRADGKATLGDLADAARVAGPDAEALVEEAQGLWSARLVTLMPRS